MACLPLMMDSLLRHSNLRSVNHHPVTLRAMIPIRPSLLLRKPNLLAYQQKKKLSSVYEDDKYPPRECFIPKKLYCMQSNAGTGRSSTPTSTTDQDPSLPPLYPTQRQSSPVEYSETDVSVAMILATGFGRKRRSESPVIEEV